DAASPSNRYTVSFFGPAARITPGFPCLLTSATPVAAAVVDVAVVGAAYRVAEAFVVVVLPLLPQPAASSAPVVATAPRAKECLTWPPQGLESASMRPSPRRRSRALPSRGAGALADLRAGPDQELVHAHVRRLPDRVDHGVGDVLGRQRRHAL